MVWIREKRMQMREKEAAIGEKGMQMSEKNKEIRRMGALFSYLHVFCGFLVHRFGYPAKHLAHPVQRVG